jgi:hypothetical protein
VARFPIETNGREDVGTEESGSISPVGLVRCDTVKTATQTNSNLIKITKYLEGRKSARGAAVAATRCRGRLLSNQ